MFVTSQETSKTTTLPTGHVGALRLHSNGGPINSGDVERLQPLPTDATDEEIKKRYERDGYVLVKGLLPVDVVRKMRKAYFEYVQSTGILKEGTDSTDGVYCGDDPAVYGGPGTVKTGTGEQIGGAFMEKSWKAHYADFYKEFQTHPNLANFVQRMTGWDEVKLLQRQMLRTNVPGAEATAVHYDQIFLRAGPPTSVTAWIPIGRVSVEGGGLIYLERSHDIGEQFENDFAKKAENFNEQEKLSAFNANMMRGGSLSNDAGQFGTVYGRKWLVADYEDGDVIFHNPYMIHASAVNEDKEGRIRLATDLRFVNPNAPYDTRWTDYWKPGDGL